MQTAYWLVVKGDHIYLPCQAIPFGTAQQWGFHTDSFLHIGTYRQYPVHLIQDATALYVAERSEFYSLRDQLGRDESEFHLLNRAVGLSQFFQSHRFCPACATTLDYLTGELAKVCPACHQQYFPRINPAIIVGVRHGQKLLLAQHHRHKNPAYTVLAGFVEIGETIENAVQREVFEESGIDVKHIEYIQSQPWCFPNSLMLGFLAEYDAGEIQIQKNELIDAQWFDIHHLPENLPEHGTIARALIEYSIQRILAK